MEVLFIGGGAGQRAQGARPREKSIDGVKSLKRQKDSLSQNLLGQGLSPVALRLLLPYSLFPIPYSPHSRG